MNLADVTLVQLQAATKAQILNFINDFSKKHGFAPSHEEIKKYFHPPQT